MCWRRYFFQGVHMLLTFGSSADGKVAPWAPGEARTNKLVFIGRDLDRAQLRRDFAWLPPPRSSRGSQTSARQSCEQGFLA